MKDKLRWIIPLSIAFLLGLFLVLYYFLKPGIKYIYDESSDTYLVDKAYGNSKKYVIPEKFNGKDVSGINTRAFYKNDNLEEIVFEKAENIKYIKRLAFSECDNLKVIDLRYVEVIERNAFSYDYSLNNIEIGAKNIASSAFYKCTSLDNISLLDGVKTIGAFSFSYCSFKEIKLPKSINNVYNDAFKYCDEISKISCYYKTDIPYLTGLKGYEKYYD